MNIEVITNEKKQQSRQRKLRNVMELEGDCIMGFKISALYPVLTPAMLKWFSTGKSISEKGFPP